MWRVAEFDGSRRRILRGRYSTYEEAREHRFAILCQYTGGDYDLRLIFNRRMRNHAGHRVARAHAVDRNLRHRDAARHARRRRGGEEGELRHGPEQPEAQRERAWEG